MNPCFFLMSHWDFRALHSFVFRNCQHSALRGLILRSNALMGSKLPAGCPFQGPEVIWIYRVGSRWWVSIHFSKWDHNSHCPSKFPWFSQIFSILSYGVPFHGFSGWGCWLCGRSEQISPVPRRQAGGSALAGIPVTARTDVEKWIVELIRIKYEIWNEYDWWHYK